MITVNGENRTLENPVSVTEYLKACNYIPVQVVVELNEEIIKRENYDTTVLKDGDVVEILHFMRRALKVDAYDSRYNQIDQEQRKGAIKK